MGQIGVGAMGPRASSAAAPLPHAGQSPLRVGSAHQLGAESASSRAVSADLSHLAQAHPADTHLFGQLADGALGSPDAQRLPGDAGENPAFHRGKTHLAPLLQLLAGGGGAA